jgi:hypothetical protein
LGPTFIKVCWLLSVDVVVVVEEENEMVL